jgi:hypothetical protein
LGSCLRGAKPRKKIILPRESSAGKVKNEIGAKGIANDTGRATTDVLDERRQIRHVLFNSALSVQTLTLTVPATVR